MSEQAQVEQKFSLQVMKRDSNYMMVTSKLATLSKDMESLEIKGDDDMEMAALFRSEALTYLDMLEQIRVKYKRPFLDHMAETDKAFRLLVSPVGKAIDALDIKIKDRRAEVKRMADEEARRIAEEQEKQEKERLRKIEQEKIKVEEETGIKIGATAKEIGDSIEAQLLGKVEVAPGIEIPVEPIRETSAPVTKIPKKLSEQTGGLLQGKMFWKWEVIKEEDIPQNYLMIDPERCDDPALVMLAPRSVLIPNKKLIDSAVQKNEVREIQGLRIFEVEELASKKFKK